jgi:hypothetical protein
MAGQYIRSLYILPYFFLPFSLTRLRAVDEENRTAADWVNFVAEVRLFTPEEKPRDGLKS